MTPSLRWLLETTAFIPFCGGLLRAIGKVVSGTGSGVTAINTTAPGITGGPITTTGALAVQWNAGQTNTLGSEFALTSQTLHVSAALDGFAYGMVNGAWTRVLPLTGGLVTGTTQFNAAVTFNGGLTESGTATFNGPLNVTATGGSVARSVQDHFGDVANVLDFGADPTGATDSSAAFNAAASSISASGYYKSVYVPAGKYRLNNTINLINGQSLDGDSRATSWLYADGNFNMAAAGLIVIKTGTQFLDPGPAIRNIGITMVQPNVSTTPRASCVQYPPVISCQANCGRIQIDHVRIGGAWNGITDNGNNVVFNISDLELGALNVGISIGVGTTGPQDFCHIHGLHFWNFDCPFTAFSDGNTVALDIGRCDGLNVTDCCVFEAQIIVEAAGSASTVTHFSNLMLDADMASCTFNGGLHHHISNCYSSAGASRVRPAITVNGSTEVRITNWYSHNSSPFPMWDVQAGSLAIESAQVRHNNQSAVVGRTSAGNALLSVHNAEVWTSIAGAYTQPIFQQGGGASRMKLDNITVDNLGNASSGTAVSYASDVAGNMLGSIVLPSGWTTTLPATLTNTQLHLPAGLAVGSVAWPAVTISPSSPSATNGQVQIMPPAVLASESKLRLFGTFPSGGDTAPYMAGALRSGYSALSWTASYLDVWLTNAANSTPGSDANTMQVARFTPTGLTLPGGVVCGEMFAPQDYLNGAPGSTRGLLFQTNSSGIWNVVTRDAEGGGNAGANLSFEALADSTGALIGSGTLKLWRASNLVDCANLQVDGTVSGAGFTSLFASPPAIGSTTPAAATFATPLTVGSNTAVGQQTIVLNSAAGNARMLKAQTGGVDRWQFTVSTDAEGPVNSNNGSNFQLWACNDAGTGFLEPLSITRSTGQVTMNRSVAISAGSVASTIDGTAIGGTTPAAGTFTTLTTSGVVTVNNATAGLAFGSNVGGTNWDLSHHISLNAAGYGFGITANRLNYVCPASHVFVVGTTDELTITNSGVTAANGFSCGSLVGGSNIDLSKHIALYSTTVGFSVTSGRLNYVAAGNNHVFSNAGIDSVTISSGALTSAVPVTVPAAAAGGINWGAGGAWIKSGAGVASGTAPSGSIWLRTDGSAGARLYVSAGGGTWTAVASV